MNLQRYRQELQQQGLGRTLFLAAYRGANRVTSLAVWDAVVVTMDLLDQSFLRHDQQAPGRFLEREELKTFAKDPTYNLDGRFVDHAMGQGDRCFGFCRDGVLAAYGWYSQRPTETGGGLRVQFDPAYVYMYKGFTHPNHRGQRLHAIGMASALAAYTCEGARGMLSYIESWNSASLRSCERMGYRTFGHVVIWGEPGRAAIYATPGCARYGFRAEELGPAPQAVAVAAR